MPCQCQTKRPVRKAQARCSAIRPSFASTKTSEPMRHEEGGGTTAPAPASPPVAAVTTPARRSRSPRGLVEEEFRRPGGEEERARRRRNEGRSWRPHRKSGLLRLACLLPGPEEFPASLASPRRIGSNRTLGGCLLTTTPRVNAEESCKKLQNSGKQCRIAPRGTGAAIAPIG